MDRIQDEAQDTKYEIRTTNDENGSAIILAVVLVSLLAIIAVIFIQSARVDNISTSAISDNENLNLAANTIVSQISEILAQNSPHTDANGNQVGVYFTYPDGNNPWLANLEPVIDTAVSPPIYYWRQVSSLNGYQYSNIIAGVLPDYSDKIIHRIHNSCYFVSTHNSRIK